MVKEYGYEYNATRDEELLSRVGWSGTNKKLWGAYSLRSGRDALKLIAREYPNTTVFLPSLCCDSMITPFEMYGCKIVYYPLTSKMRSNFPELLNKLQMIKGKKLLLSCDYFAIKMLDSDQIEKLKMMFNDLILIKDITHNLLSAKESESCVDYTVSSLRKWMNIPDGGLLWAKRELNNTLLPEKPMFAEQRLRAQCMRTEYFNTGNDNTKAEYRKIFSCVSSLLDDDPSPVKMTEYSYEIALKADWDHIKQIRRENASALINALRDNQNIRLINYGINDSDLYVPILIENRDVIQGILSSKGIFNTIIWPLRKEQMLSCSTAKYVTKHMLAIPCDQRYTKEDMLYIGKEITRVVNGEKDNDSGSKYIAASGNTKSKRNGTANSCG